MSCFANSFCIGQKGFCLAPSGYLRCLSGLLLDSGYGANKSLNGSRSFWMLLLEFDAPLKINAETFRMFSLPPSIFPPLFNPFSKLIRLESDKNIVFARFCGNICIQRWNSERKLVILCTFVVKTKFVYYFEKGIRDYMWNQKNTKISFYYHQSIVTSINASWKLSRKDKKKLLLFSWVRNFCHCQIL